MACHDCGECRYSNTSVADLWRRVTSSGLNCPPDRTDSYSGLSFAGAGVWSQAVGGATATVSKNCASGGWSFMLPPPPPAPMPPGPPRDCALPAEVGESLNVPTDTCLEFHSIRVTNLAGGAWIQVELRITVRNNDGC